ncbi:VOC family protein [Halocatena marina]
MQKLTPNLWFDTEAEEAAKFYVSVFDNSTLGTVTQYDPASAAVSDQPEGSVMTVAFELEGQEFVALNGGPQFRFTPAVSFIVNCHTKEEVDQLWAELSDGGESICHSIHTHLAIDTAGPKTSMASHGS